MESIDRRHQALHPNTHQADVVVLGRVQGSVSIQTTLKVEALSTAPEPARIILPIQHQVGPLEQGIETQEESSISLNIPTQTGTRSTRATHNEGRSRAKPIVPPRRRPRGKGSFRKLKESG